MSPFVSAVSARSGARRASSRLTHFARSPPWSALRIVRQNLHSVAAWPDPNACVYRAVAAGQRHEIHAPLDREPSLSFLTALCVCTPRPDGTWFRYCHWRLKLSKGTQLWSSLCVLRLTETNAEREAAAERRLLSVPFRPCITLQVPAYNV